MKRLIVTLVMWLALCGAASAASLSTYGANSTTCGSGTSCNNLNVSGAATPNQQAILVCVNTYGGTSAATGLGVTINSNALTQWGGTVTQGKSVKGCFHKTIASGDANAAIDTSWTNANSATITVWMINPSDNVAPTFETPVGTVCASANGCTPTTVTPSQNGNLIFESCNLSAGSPEWNSSNLISPFPTLMTAADISGFFGWSASSGAPTMAGVNATVGGPYDYACLVGAVKASGAGSVVVGTGGESFNSGSAASVSPRVSANAHPGDMLVSGLVENTTGIAITPATGAGTYTAAGVTYGVSTLITGDAHTAVSFNQASNAGVNMTLPPDLGLAIAGTEECWVKFSGSSWDGTIMLMGTGTTGWGVGVGNTTTGNLGTNFLAMIQNVAFVKPTGSPSIVSGTVYHVVGENDSSAFNVWINGTKYAVSNHGGTAQTTNLNIGGTTVYSPISDTQQKCAFYDYELSQAQISNHYLAGTTLPANYGSAGVTGGATYDAVVQNDGPTIYWNLGEASGTTAASIGQTGGLSWTQYGSAAVDPTSVASLSIFTVTAIGANGAAQFNFALNPASSDGIIVDVGNINTTTPVDVSGSLTNAGLAQTQEAPLNPTPNDELALSFNGYKAGPSGERGGQYPQAITIGSHMSAYYTTPNAAAVAQAVDSVKAPYASITLGLKAASTPARTTANVDINQLVTEMFSTSAPSPPAAGVGPWFF